MKNNAILSVTGMRETICKLNYLGCFEDSILYTLFDSDDECAIYCLEPMYSEKYPIEEEFINNLTIEDAILYKKIQKTFSKKIINFEKDICTLAVFDVLLDYLKNHDESIL